MNPLANDLRSVLALLERLRHAFDYMEPVDSDYARQEVRDIADRLTALLHGGGGEAVDRGPWRWEYDRNKTEDARLNGVGAYELQSEDFAHEVRIEVSGDFADHDDVERYMRWLQATLNAATTPPPQPRGDMVLAEAIRNIRVPARGFHEGWRDEEIWEWALREAAKLVESRVVAAPGEGSGEG